MSLPDPTDNPYLTIAMFCALRWGQGASEKEVAKKLHFDSVEQMRNTLKAWEIPDWLVGEEPASVPTNRRRRERDTHERLGRGSGPVKELPSADAAAPLFREKLEALIQATGDLKDRKERLQGGRFIQSAVRKKPTDFSGEPTSGEQWQYVREIFDLDPEDEDFVFLGGSSTFSLGRGTLAPQAPLPALIGAYLLAGGDIEPLVEALHPDPASAEWPKIRKRVEGRKGSDNLDGLRALAAQLAILVRGGRLGVGSPKAELSNDEVNLACRITERRTDNIPDEQIYEELCSLWRSPEGEFSWDEFQRLADLELKWPWF